MRKKLKLCHLLHADDNGTDTLRLSSTAISKQLLLLLLLFLLPLPLLLVLVRLLLLLLLKAHRQTDRHTDRHRHIGRRTDRQDQTWIRKAHTKPPRRKVDPKPKTVEVEVGCVCLSLLWCRLVAASPCPVCAFKAFFV